MEQWARDAILQHNALMNAAWQLVCTANGHCSNTSSDRLEELLKDYAGVCPDTGNMETDA